MLRVPSAFVVLAFASLVICSALWAAEPPNLIFILSDDQRHDFLGCADHPVLQTPHLDRLAADGVRFRNAFVTTSICAASRATLFTGLVERSHAFTFGTPPIAKRGIEMSYPTRLRESGYRSGFVGKFGVQIEGKPGATMFDWYRPLNRSPYRKVIDGKTRHVTDLIVDEAIGFMSDTEPDQPFVLSISFNAAHAEDHDKADHYPPPETEMSLYQDVAVDQPRLVDTFDQLPDFFKRSMNRDRWYWRWDTAEKYEKNVRDYYRLISAIDRNVGRIIESIQEQGRAENTVIVFMGDNGYYKGDRGLAGKWTHFEESLRVPLIIYDPRQRRPGKDRVVDATVLNLDIAPTLLDLAKVEIPKEYQGNSLVGWIGGDDPDWKRTEFFCEHRMNHPAIPKWEGVRTDRFTYARYYEQNPPFEFLHDRQTDPDQRRNMVENPEYADTLTQLRTRTEQLSKQYQGESLRP